MPDIDWGQVIFLVLVVVVGFIRWVANLIQQKKEAKERSNLSPEERARREAAWRKQIGEEVDVEKEEDPFRELKELFEQFNKPPQPQPAPPPLPQRLPVKTPPAPPRPPRVASPVAIEPALPLPARSALPIIPLTPYFGLADARPVPARLASLRRELASPQALRQAILVREILGPPKALRNESW